MISRNLRAFVDRDWTAAREAKERYGVELARTRVPLDALRLADDLRRHAQQVRPNWPSAEDRRADLEAHIRLSELLRRGGDPHRR